MDHGRSTHVVTHECPKCKGGSYDAEKVCRGHLASGFHDPRPVVPITPQSHHWPKAASHA